MRKIFRGRNFQADKTKFFRVNEKIFAKEVMVIDEQGQKLGVLDKWQALQEAKNRGFDLVEVSPKENPPICKIMDYGSFKYQQKKSEKKQRAKNKTTEIKTIKLSSRISQHDTDFRVNQALKFLEEKNKVKIELQLRGRENQHADLAREMLGNFVKEVRLRLPENSLKVEQEVKKQGGNLSAIISS
ncbi:MAG: translation initiation factor IF-3 [Patescibacteria group bacterium]